MSADTRPFFFELTAAHRLERRNDPSSQRPLTGQQVRLRTRFSAVSPGTELAAFRGDPPLRPTKSVYPRLVGYCHVGEVIGIGADVADLALGDLVLSHCSHRSHAVLEAHQILYKLPKGADAGALATTYLFHLGYNACLRSEMRPGMRVAVVGLGVLGLTSAATANLAGAQVTGLSNHGATDYDPGDFGLQNILRKDSDIPDQFDIVITTSNDWTDWQLALRLARRDGMIATLGFPGRGQDAPAFNPLAAEYVYDKQLTIRACGLTSNHDVPAHDIRFTLKRNCAFLAEAIVQGRLPARALISDARPADDLPQIYYEMNRSRRQSGTTLLNWTAP